MTRPVSTCISLLSLTLALLVGAAMWLGLGQPPSDWASLLRFDDCQLPCWIGIEPGKTTLTDAQQQVQLAYADNPDYTLEDYGAGQFAVNDNRSHYRIGITLDAGDERQTVPPTVQQILLWADVIPSQRVSVLDLYGSLGTPEDLRLARIGGLPYLMLLYRTEQVGLATTTLDCDRVLPAQKIYQIIISARPLDRYLGWVSTSAPWLGFRRCHDMQLALTP